MGYSIQNWIGVLNIYTPEMFGVVSGDITDVDVIRRNTLSFNLIPSGAKIIWFSAGVTYVIDDEINSLVGSKTHVEGNYAIIKRCDASKTELTVAAALGATSITVADSTGFRVGDFITITNNAAATYAGKGDQENSNRGGDLIRVTSVVGNVIGFNNASLTGLKLPENGELDGAGQFPIGSNVIRSFNMWGLGVANDYIKMNNVIFDGNVSGNDYSYDWRINNTGALEGEFMEITGCEFRNLPSENIICSGRIHFDKCHLENTTGGIMHGSTEQPLAGLNGYWVSNCTGHNVTQRSAQAGHSNAWITLSASVQEVISENNIVKNDAGTSSGFIIGPIGFTTGQGSDYSDNKIQVIGGIYENFENISSVALNTADLNQSVFDISFSGDFQFINCGDLLVRGNDIRDDGGVRNIKIVNGKITNGRIFFEEVYGAKIIDVDLTQDEDFSFASSIVGLSNVNTVGHVYIKGSNVKVKGCRIIGKTTNDDYCKRGIFATSNVKAKDSGGVDTNYGYYQNVDIENNLVMNHHEYEIATSEATTATARVIELVGWSVKNNKVRAQKDSTTQKAMLIDPGVVCDGNEVLTYLTGQIGIQALGINSASGQTTVCKGAIITNNKVFGASTTPIVASISTNTYNSIIERNQTQENVSDPSGGKSYVSSNTRIPITGIPYYINENEDEDVY